MPKSNGMWRGRVRTIKCVCREMDGKVKAKMFSFLENSHLGLFPPVCVYPCHWIRVSVWPHLFGNINLHVLSQC